MELKDKIYVREFQEGINRMWDGNKIENTSAIAYHEYIRKDALLEMLQVAKCKVSDLPPTQFFLGEEQGIEDVIAILKKL